MTQTQLFFTLLITGLMVINGAREFAYGRYAMAALLLMIPTAGWLSILFGS